MGRKKARSQPSRRSPSGQSSLAAQKRSILRSPDWITKGLAFCNYHGPWSAWEQRLLKELSRTPTYAALVAGVDYSIQVMKKPWQELEALFVCFLKACNLQCLSSATGPFIQYVRSLDGSESLESLILNERTPAVAFIYAAYGTRRRWQNAEPLILGKDMLAIPALCLGRDISSNSPWVVESQVVTYAGLFIKGSWPALERKMAHGNCHPRVAYEYAVNALQGPLPQAIETWLMLAVCDTEGNKYRQKYFAFAATKASQHSIANASSSSPPP